MPTFRNTLFHLHRQVGVKILHTHLPMKMEQSVPKRRHIKFRRRGITQKKAYKILLSSPEDRSIGCGDYPAFCLQDGGIQRPSMKLTTDFHLKKVEIKNEWSYTSTPTLAFIAWTGTTLDITLRKFNLQGVATANEGIQQQTVLATNTATDCTCYPSLSSLQRVRQRPLAVGPQMCRQHIPDDGCNGALLEL